MKLLCFPYSGASAWALYARWRRILPSWIEVRPIELPGRGHRITEPSHTQFSALIRQLSAELASDVRAPFALFGHSLGAMVAFELAHFFERELAISPTVLFTSGASGPEARDYARYARSFTDAELVDELRDLDGTHPEVLESPELLAMALPILRADFQLCGSYVPVRGRSRLRCPIHVFGGAQDSDAGDPLEWRHETSAEFGCDVFQGNHFFIHPYESQVLDRIVERSSLFLKTQSERGVASLNGAMRVLSGA